MSSSLSRREYLKLISLLPLALTDIPAKLPSVLQAQGSEKLPNILIMVFDAFSALNASLYGYRRGTTPNLSRLAEHAHVYHNHYAGGNFTSPGTATLLTGTYPWTHRAIHMHGTVNDKLADRNMFNLFGDLGYSRIGYSHNLLVTSLLHQFRESIDTFKWTRELCLADDQFADRLFPNDYNVAFWAEWLIFHGGKSKPSSLLAALLQRFNRFGTKRALTRELQDMFPRGIPSLHDLFFVLEDAIDWLISQTDSLPQPYMMYFHAMPPHEPYSTRKDFIDIFKDGWKFEVKPERFFSEGHPQDFLDRNRREYDEYLAYADSEFGRLYDSMLQSGALDNTVLVLTSDHGEMFERGIRGHVTSSLYQPVVRVPLIISIPGQDQRKDIYVPTSNVDILPTLLHLSGRKSPEWTEGDVLPPFETGVDFKEREVYSVEAKSNPKLAPLRTASVAMVRGNHKLLHYTGYSGDVPEYELFDLANDPGELNDLSQSSPGIFEELKMSMQNKLAVVNQNFV